MMNGIPALFDQISDRIAQLLTSTLDIHLKEVVQGTLIGLGLRASGQVLSFVTNLLLARLLGAQGVGVYYLAIGVTNIAAVIGRLGLDNAVIRYVAAEARTEQWSKVAGVIRRGVSIILTLTLPLAAIVFVSAERLATTVFQEPSMGPPLRILALRVTPYAIVLFYSNALKGLKRIPEALFVEIVGVALLQLPLFILLVKPLALRGAALSNLIATIVISLSALIIWRWRTPDLDAVKPSFEMRALLSSSLPLFWIALMNVITGLFDAFLIGIWLNSERVGIYATARRVAELAGFVLVAISAIIAPKFSELHSADRRNELERLARNGTKLSMLLLSPLLLMYLFIPGPILSIFGNEFTDGAMVLIIITLGNIISIAAGFNGQLLMMSGHEKILRNYSVASTLLNFALFMVLVPGYQLVGAAIARAVSLALLNIALIIIVYRRLSIISSPLLSRRNHE